MQSSFPPWRFPLITGAGGCAGVAASKSLAGCFCANGNPVPGATVTAYDVDYWWWWTSQELVGTAVTDINGAFEIDFTRCCGWWPWYWWDLRYWQVDPYLVERISAVVSRTPSSRRLPAAIPAPSLESSSRCSHPRRRRPAPACSRQCSPPRHQSRQLNLRRPRSPQQPARKADRRPAPGVPVPIWPWYPWFPWLDCGANLIFKATQVCSGQTNTVLSQTIADVNWDIPDNFTVTLNANDLACCVYTCDDQCPEGNCVIPNGICSEPNVDSIGGNVSAPPCTPAQVGLYAPGVQDRPFAGSVVLYGILGTAFNADYYEFQYATAQAGPYTPLPLAAVAGFDRYALKILPGPTFVPITVPFPVTQIPDSSATLHNVYETIAHYMAVNGNPGWTSDPNELMVLNSDVLVNGTYYLRMVAYVLTGPDQIALADTGNPGSPGVVPICDPNTGDPVVNNWWVLTLDNQAPLPTDPSGQPCGLHICTNQPTSDILQVAIVNPVTGTTTVISGCDNVCINPTDLLQIDFVAYDPDAFLDYYDLQLLYGLINPSPCCATPRSPPATRRSRPGRSHRARRRSLHPGRPRPRRSVPVTPTLSARVQPHPSGPAALSASPSMPRRGSPKPALTCCNSTSTSGPSSIATATIPNKTSASRASPFRCSALR